MFNLMVPHALTKDASSTRSKVARQDLLMAILDHPSQNPLSGDAQSLGTFSRASGRDAGELSATSLSRTCQHVPKKLDGQHL